MRLEKLLAANIRTAKRQRDKTLHRLFVCVAAWIFLSTLAPGQTPPLPAPTPTPLPINELHQWGAVTLFHGLPSDRVRAIAQTHDGVMWFGTDAGLARYDGRRTQAVTAEGLPPGRVWTLLTDEDGALWIGTENGAARYAGGAFANVPETNGQPVTAILPQSRGRIWFATEKGQVFDCQANAAGGYTARALLSQPLPSADADRPGLLPLTSLAFHNGALYAGSLSRGLFAVRNDGTAEEIYSRPRSYFVNALATHENRLWTGVWTSKTGPGLADSSAPLQPQPADAPTGTVTALLNTDKELWTGTDGQGVFRVVSGAWQKRFTFENTAGGLRSDHVFAIFVDREDVVWFGTDKGVSRYDPHAPQVENLGDAPNSNFVRTLLLSSLNLAGTNRGLYAQAPDASWQPVPELGNSTIYAAHLDAGKIALGTSTGLYVADASVDRLEFKRLVTASADATGTGGIRVVAWWRDTLYFATYGRGLERWDGNQATLVWPTNGDAAREIVSLAADSKGRLWLGTAKAGVLEFDGQTARPVPALAELAGKTVWRIIAEQENVWLATAQGLYFYRDNGVLRPFAAGVDVRDALAGEGQTAWCVTVNSGVLKVAWDEKFGALVSRLDAEQGLPSNSAFALAGDLLIGTNRGLVKYEPSRAPPLLTPTRILSKRVHLPEEARAGLRLEYPQNSLLIEMSALASRTFPEQFQYGFRLLDAKGQVVTQKLSRDAQFTMENLRPGRYRVEAVAFSRDLVASEPFAFDLVVERAPFPWFTLLLGVLLALSLAALWWGWRKNAQLTLAGAELRDARERLAHEAETERRRIARDLHDQTLADLRRLALLTDELPAGQQTAHFRQEVEEVSQEIRRICEDLSPSVLENVGLAAALEFALSNAVAQAPTERKFEYNFTCDNDLEDKLRLSAAEQIQIFRIAQEAVSNISRHARARRVTGHAGLDETGAFIFTLTDDGDGFTPNAPHTDGRGLANMQARASLLEARVSWAAAPSGGTLFRLRKE